STEVCTHFYDNDQSYPDNIEEQVAAGLRRIEKECGKNFGDAKNPLLLSVRSGARASMPGMMYTILHIALNHQPCGGLGDTRCAYDSYRRLIQMYSDVVLGVDHDKFEDILDTFKRRAGLKLDTEIDAAGLQDIVAQYKSLVKKDTGKPFPQDT